MAKVIRNIFKNETFLLSECNDGFWLHDYILGMNISMRAKTEIDAMFEGLMYYQKSLTKSKLRYEELNNKVESFLCQFDKEDY